MSYHEISVEKQYNVKCECGFGMDGVFSAGSAEEMAVGHIQGQVGEGDASTNYNHVVTITEVTKVGRNL